MPACLSSNWMPTSPIMYTCYVQCTIRVKSSISWSLYLQNCVSQTWWRMLQANPGKFEQFDRWLSFRLLRIYEESLVKWSEGTSSIQGGCSCHMVVPNIYLLVRRKLDWLQVSRCCKRRCKNLLLQHWEEKYKQCACRATSHWKGISARIRWQTWPRTHPDQVTQISFHTASVTWWNCWSQRRVVCPATPQMQAIKIDPP